MSIEEQEIVENTYTTNTTSTTEIAEITNAENQQTEISETVVLVKQTQQTTTNENSVAPTNGKIKKKFVIGTEESPGDNRENNNSTSNTELHTDSEEIVESHTDTDTKQRIESEEEEDYINITTKKTLATSTQIDSESQQQQQQPIQQPTPKEEKINEVSLLESSKPTTMTPTEAHQAAPVVTNTTVTATMQRQSAPSAKQPGKFILSTPADSPDSTPISSSPPSASDGIPNASYVNPPLVPNPPGQNPIQPNHILDSYLLSQTLDDSSEPLNYPHQPRFPPSSGGISRTQQKLLLQRQHFLADDENYLIHPRNQLRLTKVIEKINREHGAILLSRDPIIESLQRVWPKYVQEHPEVMEDDFGVGYEDSKEWGVISDHGKSVDHIGSNSIISTETLGVDSMPLHGIK